MVSRVDLARQATATTGQGTVTLGAAPAGYFTFAEAGITNGQTVRYRIDDGSDVEIGVGTYTASGTTMSRDTVQQSKISGTAGTTKLTLSGAATVTIVAGRVDFAEKAGLADNNTLSGDNTFSGENEFTDSVTITGAPAGAISRTMKGLHLNVTDSPSSGDFFPAILFETTDGSFTTENPKLLGYIGARANQTYNDDSDGGLQISFGATVNNPGTTNLPVQVFFIYEGMTVGAPTGGDKGAGSVNAQAVYDDNSLLTCYVLEAARTGVVDVEAWHARVPDRIVEETRVNVPDKRARDGFRTVVTPRQEIARRHEPAEHFAARLGDLDPDTFTAGWKATGVLPGMPTPEEWAAAPLSTGAMVQRLWELCELQAVHIAKLSDRIAALEAE